MNHNAENIDITLIEQLSSIYFVVDRNLHLSQPSQVLHKYIPFNPENLSEASNLLDIFNVIRPNKLASFKNIIDSKNSMTLLACKDEKFAVRGQFVTLANEPDHLVFVGAPWLAWMNTNQPDTRLMISDFKPVDPQLDQMVLLSTEKQNINDLQQLTQELKLARDEAQQASQNQADFFAIMSHEMRTPLSGVITALELINNNNLDSQTRKMFEIVQNSSENLKYVVDHVLDYSKLQAGGFENQISRFNFRETVQSVMKIISAQANDKGNQLLTTIAPSVYEYINADGDKIRQVIINFLSNAVKYTANGSVHLTALMLDNDRLKICVTDTGKGISLSVKDKIFEPFLTYNANLSEQESGTGLGLNISKRLVEIMNGDIGFDSSPNQGSNFYFTIPVTKAETPVKNPVKLDTNGNKIFTGDVLLVEDNKTNQYLNRILLEQRGLSVDVADNGKLAIEKINNKNYALIFMDISMPIMDGITATKLLRKIYSQDQLPIVAMTAHIGDNHHQNFIEVGMDDVITKPIDNDLLTNVLERRLGQSGSDQLARTNIDKCLSAKQLTTTAYKNINIATLDELLLSIGEEAFTHLTDLFISEINQGSEDIITAYTVTDMDAILEKAHTIMSSAKATGCDSLAKNLQQIQLAIHKKQHHEFKPLIDELKNVTKSSVLSLQDYKMSIENSRM